MSQYEIIIACVAMTNLILTLATLSAARAKAATTRIDALETTVMSRLHRHDEEIQRLRANGEVAVTHEHLAELYRDIKALSQQVHNLAGNQQQMNELLRQLLAKELRG